MFFTSKPNPELSCGIMPLRLKISSSYNFASRLLFLLFIYCPELLDNTSDFRFYPLPDWLLSSGREMNASFYVGSFVIQ